MTTGVRIDKYKFLVAYRAGDYPFKFHLSLIHHFKTSSFSGYNYFEKAALSLLLPKYEVIVLYCLDISGFVEV